MEIQNLSKNFKKKFKTKDLSKRGKCRFDEPKKKKQNVRILTFYSFVEF